MYPPNECSGHLPCARPCVGVSQERGRQGPHAHEPTSHTTLWALQFCSGGNLCGCVPSQKEKQWSRMLMLERTSKITHPTCR